MKQPIGIAICAVVFLATRADAQTSWHLDFGVGDWQYVQLVADGASVLRVEEVGDNRTNIRAVRNFQGRSSLLRPAEGYKDLEVVGISASGDVFGYATAPLDESDCSLVPVLVPVESSVADVIPMLNDSKAAIVTAASTDGNCLVGSSSGTPTIWLRSEPTVGDRQSWQPDVLPLPASFHEADRRTRKLVVSDDGSWIASYVGGSNRGNVIRWRRSPAGEWVPEDLGRLAVSVMDINNAGIIVGSARVLVDQVETIVGVQLVSREQIDYINPSEPYTSIVLHSINNSGVAVGYAEAFGNDALGPRGVICTERGAFYFPDPPLGSSAFVHPLAIDDDCRVAGYLSLEVSPHTIGFVVDGVELNSLIPLNENRAE